MTPLDTSPGRLPVDIIESARRKKTISAQVRDGRIIVRVPARMDPQRRKKAIDDIVAKLSTKMSSSAITDDDLADRARRLNDCYLDGRARIGSIRWVSNQGHQWGSCTTTTAAIRISDRLRHVPDYVLDAVIVHELAHTIEPNHTPAFYALADRVDRAERARGFLEAYQMFGPKSG